MENNFRTNLAETNKTPTGPVQDNPKFSAPKIPRKRHIQSFSEYMYDHDRREAIGPLAFELEKNGASPKEVHEAMVKSKGLQALAIPLTGSLLTNPIGTVSGIVGGALSGAAVDKGVRHYSGDTYKTFGQLVNQNNWAGRMLGSDTLGEFVTEGFNPGYWIGGAAPRILKRMVTPNLGLHSSRSRIEYENWGGADTSAEVPYSTGTLERHLKLLDKNPLRLIYPIKPSKQATQFVRDVKRLHYYGVNKEPQQPISNFTEELNSPLEYLSNGYETEQVLGNEKNVYKIMRIDLAVKGGLSEDLNKLISQALESVKNRNSVPFQATNHPGFAIINNKPKLVLKQKKLKPLNPDDFTDNDEVFNFTDDPLIKDLTSELSVKDESTSNFARDENGVLWGIDLFRLK